MDPSSAASKRCASSARSEPQASGGWAPGEGKRCASSARILFLGRRAPALRAARRLGVEVVQVDREPPGACPAGVVARLPWPEASGPDDADGWRELAARLPEPERIAAVVGLTEASVVPAAQLRAALGLPGLDVATARRCTDKLRMKQAVRAAGIACADFVPCEPGTPPELLLERLGLPLVLKPRASSGGRGLRIVRSARELPDPLPAGYLAERFVPGVEMSCESIVRGGEVAFANPTEYLVVREANLVPARLAPAQLEGVLALNRAALAALGVGQGMTHLELFLGAGGPVFSELAARPPGGYVMRLIELAYGFDPWAAWLFVQLGEEPELVRAPRCAAGAWVLHPGPGRVRAVHGVETVRALGGTDRVRVRVAAGDRVAPRLGSGDEVGHFIVTGTDAEQAAARLRAARQALVFELERADEGTLPGS